MRYGYSEREDTGQEFSAAASAVTEPPQNADRKTAQLVKGSRQIADPTIKISSVSFTDLGTYAEADIILNIDDPGNSPRGTLEVWTNKAATAPATLSNVGEGSVSIAPGDVAAATVFTLAPGPGTDTLLENVQVPKTVGEVKRIYARWTAGTSNRTTGVIALDVITLDLGTGTITTAALADGAVTEPKIGALAVATGKIQSAAITLAKMAANSVDTAQLVAAAVESANIAALAVTEAKIGALAVTTAKLDAAAVTLAKMAANSVDTSQLVAAAVTTAEIAANTILAGNIAANAVTTSEIGPLAVTGAEIASSAVTAAKIAANTITAGEIAANTITAAEIFAGTITTTEIAANTIVAGNIAANTVTAAEIAAATITTAEIAAVTILAGNIAANTITAAQIAANTITATEIVANTITAAEIAAGTITTTEILANTILAADIAAGTITTAEIAANTIVAGNIAAGTITTTEIAANTIVAGNIAAATITGTEINVANLQAISANVGNLVVETSGSVRSGQTAYDTGTGFWIGNVSGTPKFSIGNASGNKMTWDGTSLSITGLLTADALTMSSSQETFTGTQNNWDPSNYGYISWDGGFSNAAITGISGGVEGRIIIFSCPSADPGTLTFTNEDSGSTAANRIRCFATRVLNAGGGLESIAFIYDAAQSRWRLWAMAP